MSPRSPSRSQSTKRLSFSSPVRPGFTAGKIEPSDTPSRESVQTGPVAEFKLPTSAAKPVTGLNLGNAGLSHSAHIDSLEQTQINRKLQTDIQELVSAQIDSTTKVLEVEAENERLRARLRNSEEEYALLEDTVKRVEGREQAAIALLSDTEAVHNATKKAYARDREEMLLLKDSYEAVNSAKIKAETDLKALKEKFGALEAQFLRAQEQLRSSSLSKPSAEPSARSESPRLGTDVSRCERIYYFNAPYTHSSRRRQVWDRMRLASLLQLQLTLYVISALRRLAFRMWQAC